MKARLTDNLSYKFVALGVAFILWLSMLGRKDSTLTREVELQMMLGAGIELETRIPQLVRVEFAGPRIALKKINSMNPIYTVDLSGSRPGRQVVRLSHDGLNLPIGARVLSIEPREFTVILRESKTGDGR
jgi:YbbR domain-containing protein